MAARELFVLGTASQVPTRHRNHNSYLLRWDDQGILFDPGEGTQRQLILAGLSATVITHICITHFHGDHCLGLPGVIQRLSLDNAGPVSVHYPASGQVFFERLRDASIYVHRQQLEARPIAAAGVIHEAADFFLEAIALDHEVPCFGYRLREKDAWRLRPDRLAAVGLHGPAIGELVRNGRIPWNGGTLHRHEVSEIRPGQSFAFVMDTRRCAGAEQLALGADLLVCESTFHSSETELAQQAGHMTSEQAGQLARVAGVRKLVLGHFSQRYLDLEPLLLEARVAHQETVLALEPDPQTPQRHRIAVPERAAIRFHGEFEVHVTVHTADTTGFSEICQQLGLKSIVIELAAADAAQQPMTQSLHRGDFNVVRAEAEGIATLLREAGFAVVRRKIEARYDARGVPEADAEAVGLPPSCYFEYHVSIALAGAGQLGELSAVASRHAAHLSRNARKQHDTAQSRFVTLRAPRVGRCTADARYARLLQDLQQAGFAVASERREFTVYDSSLDLDRGWLAA